MARPERTLVARLTPAGPAALATIGVCGPAALDLAERLFEGPKANLRRPDRLPRPRYGRFGAELKDDVVLTVLRTEPVAELEIHCHGGAAMVEALLDALVAAGAVAVPAADYLRAQGGSAIRLEAAEALAQCATARTAAILLDQFNGALEAAFDRIARGQEPELAARLLGWAAFGRHLVRPWRVLLFGRANVGKSSLLNRLAGFERTLAADQPGTTRDLVRVTTALDGWPVELGDGAGFEDQLDPAADAADPAGALQAQARQRLTAALADADLRVLVCDLSRPPTAADRELQERLAPELVVGNKLDLPGAWDHSARAALAVTCSAATGDHLPTLAQAISRRLVPQVPDPGTPIPFTDRQLDWLRASTKPGY